MRIYILLLYKLLINLCHYLSIFIFFTPYLYPVFYEYFHYTTVFHLFILLFRILLLLRNFIAF